MPRLRLGPTSITAAMVLTACTPSGGIDVDRMAQIGMEVAPKMETGDGAQCRAAAEWEKNEGRAHPASADVALQEKLQRVADTIADANGLRRFTYQVRLAQAAEPSAFTPGCGVIYVTEPMIGIAQTESQIAMLLAHEMAHVEQGHVVESRRDTTAMALAGETIKARVQAAFGSRPVTQITEDLAASTVLSQYSQAAERKADEIGLGYYVNAGYRPSVAHRLFVNLGRSSGSKSTIGNMIKGSHPLADTRADHLRGIAATMPNPKRGIEDTEEWDRLTQTYRI